MAAQGQTSPKVMAGTAAAALSTIIWTLVSTLTDVFTQTQIAALTGATATVLAALAAWLVPDPLRHPPDQA